MSSLTRTKRGYRCRPGPAFPTAIGVKRGSEDSGARLRCSRARDSTLKVDLPLDLQRVLLGLVSRVGLPPESLLGGMLSTLGAANGKGAVLETKFAPAGINPSLSFVLCGSEVSLMERVALALSQPLFDEQDRRLTELEQSRPSVEDRIEAIRSRSEAYFGADVVRDPVVEANFSAQIERLRSLGRSSLVVVDPDASTLWKAAGNSDGMLAMYRERGLARLLEAGTKSTHAFELAVCAYQRRTPESRSRGAKRGALIRPVLSTLAVCSQQIAGRLLCSTHPVVRDFADQSIFCALASRSLASASSGGVWLPPLWPARLSALARLRDSGTTRRLRLSGGAEALLAEYSRELDRSGRGGEPWFVQAPVLAEKLSLNLQLWVNLRSLEIGTGIMRQAIALSRWLLEQRAATVQRCVAGEEEHVHLQKAALMRAKLAEFAEPVLPRELYRTYDDQRKELHEPQLSYLLRTGQVHQFEDGRVQLCEATGKGRV